MVLSFFFTKLIGNMEKSDNFVLAKDKRWLFDNMLIIK
jgi:hypothetical protein